MANTVITVLKPKSCILISELWRCGERSSAGAREDISILSFETQLSNSGCKPALQRVEDAQPSIVGWIVATGTLLLPQNCFLQPSHHTTLFLVCISFSAFKQAPETWQCSSSWPCISTHIRIPPCPFPCPKPSGKRAAEQYQLLSLLRGSTDLRQGLLVCGWAAVATATSFLPPTTQDTFMMRKQTRCCRVLGKH